MHFHAHHGCSEEERQQGGEFTVSIEMTMQCNTACGTDEIADTVDYAEVYSAIKQIMQQPCKLIETVAHKIVNNIIENHQNVSAVRVTVSKLNPPIPEADIKSSSAELYYTR